MGTAIMADVFPDFESLQTIRLHPQVRQSLSWEKIVALFVCHPELVSPETDAIVRLTTHMSGGEQWFTFVRVGDGQIEERDLRNGGHIELRPGRRTITVLLEHTL